MQTALVIGVLLGLLVFYAVLDLKRFLKDKARRDYQFELFERLVWAVEKIACSDKVGLNDEK